ncbi:hypothetical protein AC579_5189 [Pseudocercospora musae]|uniref:Uncharacterized protein n=1 Tax=Pseudocercospora musae TaxID=113226 RepID=A0A139IBC7_9PEZI|nr:hypothetical protein AC579_5189 [Pseudocercospora musae]
MSDMNPVACLVPAFSGDYVQEERRAPSRHPIYHFHDLLRHHKSPSRAILEVHSTNWWQRQFFKCAPGQRGQAAQDTQPSAESTAVPRGEPQVVSQRINDPAYTRPHLYFLNMRSQVTNIADVQLTVNMAATYSQFFPPPPTLTESNLASQTGKVFIVTRGATGVDYGLCQILCNAGKVYIAGRSERNANIAIEKIQSPSSPQREVGEVHVLPLDLSNLNTMKPAVSTFTSQETRLDVLFNNAAVSYPPQGPIDAHGNELQLGTNCPLPFESFWTSCIACEFTAKNGLGLRKQDSDMQKVLKAGPQYGYTLRVWDFERYVTQSPRNLKTELTRHFGWIVPWLVGRFAMFGAHTELWCGLSEELDMSDGDGCVVPWGRRYEKPREDISRCSKEREQGGNGVAREFGEWCEEMMRD